MELNWKLFVLVLLICPHVGVSLRKEALAPVKGKDNPCIGQKMCGECVAAGKDCAWCQAQNYDAENKERCNLKSKHTSCPTDDLISPSSVLLKTEDKIPTDGSGPEPPIQIQPQIINLKMRPNDPQKFTLNYRLASNYPVDLYYLMDMSNSMRDDRDKLAAMGINIANVMNNITNNNFHIGFGTFVDKVTMPFVTNQISPCEGCDPAYGFTNQLSLNSNHAIFQTAVQNAKISGSLDVPEGGADAVMQAVTCESDIGWRPLARRILLYATDAGLHFAGDGKLGGIIKPNDGLCHLTNKMYTESSTQDYPSVSQIASKLMENNINMIFAVTENQLQSYSQLKNFLPGSVTGQLLNDSVNIVELIKQNYLKITSKVQMTSVGTDDVIVRYFSRCKNKDGPLMETNVCEGLTYGDSVSFEVEVEVKECPIDSTGYSRKFDITPIGLSDKLEVRMELICKCDCESSTVANHPNCNGHGSLICGTCDCNDKYYGKTCKCFTGNGTQTETDQLCKGPDSDITCSGQGQCVCGTCECNFRTSNTEEKYSGKFCQCDDYGCPFYDGALCGGTGHGSCKCNKCECLPDFTEDDCSCSKKTDNCIASDGSLCGGPSRGLCQCNKCVCKPQSQYQGATCQDCKYCEMVCNQHKECVQCVAHGTGKKKDSCEECKALEYITVENVLPEGANSCEFIDDDECRFYYAYSYNKDNELKIVAQRTKECPTKVNVVGIVIGSIVAVAAILLGLLLAWRLIIYLKDKRELAELIRETQDPRWAKTENPVFRPATTHYKNPMYKGKKGEKAAIL